MRRNIQSELKSVLLVAILLSLLVELVLMFLVYQKIGDQRVPYQIVRLVFQLFFVGLIFTSKAKIGLFLLTAYHIVSGLFIWYSSVSDELFGKTLMIYHIAIGLIIYFHDVIESKLNI